MNHWRILGIGDKSFCRGIRSELKSLSPGCLVDLASTFEEGQELLLMYTYDVVIADFESPIVLELTPLMAERGFPVVAVSGNDLPDYRGDIHVASLVHLDDPRAIVLTALRVLQHYGVMRLRSKFNKIFMWLNRAPAKLIPENPRDVNSYATLLFY